MFKRYGTLQVIEFEGKYYVRKKGILFWNYAWADVLSRSQANTPLIIKSWSWWANTLPSVEGMDKDSAENVFRKLLRSKGSIAPQTKILHEA